MPGDFGEACSGVRMTDMLQVNVAPHRNETGGNGERVTERAVGIGKAEEQIAVLVVRRAADDLPVGSQHLERMHRIVDESMPERRRLDSDAGDGAAEGDRLELRHDRRHGALRERRVGESLVGNHSLGLDDAGTGVDPDDVGEAREVDPGRAPRRAIAKEVRCPLREARRGRATGSRELGAQPHRLVGVPRHARGRYRNARLIG